MIAPVDALIRPEPRDAGRIAAMLASAMLDDPLQNHYFQDHPKKEELGRALFRLLAAYGIRQGNLLSTSARFEGVALWQTPQDAVWRGAAGLLGGGLRLMLAAGWPVIRRMVQASFFGYRLRRQLVPGPHWYLGLLAVAREHRGKGYAGALLRPVLELARRQGLPCYLETHKTANVGLYEHFGFRVAAQVLVPQSGVRQWCMVKEAD